MMENNNVDATLYNDATAFIIDNINYYQQLDEKFNTLLNAVTFVNDVYGKHITSEDTTLLKQSYAEKINDVCKTVVYSDEWIDLILILLLYKMRMNGCDLTNIKNAGDIHLLTSNACFQQSLSNVLVDEEATRKNCKKVE